MASRILRVIAGFGSEFDSLFNGDRSIMSMTLEPAIDVSSHRPSTRGSGLHTCGVDFCADCQPTFTDLQQTFIPTRGLPADYVSELISEQLLGDGDPAFNLGTFSTVSRDLHKDQLVLQAINKNLIDQNAYPEMRTIHERVIAMLARLFHASRGKRAIRTGTATREGSSGAIVPGLLT